MLSQYLDQLLAQSRQRVTLLEEVSSILVDAEAAEDQLIGRLAGLGRYAQQEQARPLRPAHEPVQYVPFSQPMPTLDGPPQQHVRHVPDPRMAPQSRPLPPVTQPPAQPISQHPIQNASYELKQLLKNTEDAVRSFMPSRAAPPPVPQRQPQPQQPQKRTA